MRSRDRLRMRCHDLLIDASTGMQVWTHTFDRKFSEILEIQDRIAESASLRH